MGTGGLKYDPVSKAFVPLTEASAVADELPVEELPEDDLLPEAEDAENPEPIRAPAPVELTGQQPIFYYWMGIAVLLMAWFLFMAGYIIRGDADPDCGTGWGGARSASARELRGGR